MMAKPRMEPLLLAGLLAAVPAGPASGPALVGVAPLYASDPDDPWNRIRHLLFATTVRARVPAEATVAPEPPGFPVALGEGEREQALKQYYEQRYLASWSQVERGEGADGPDFLYTLTPRFLLRTPRFQQVTAVLEEELERPPPGAERTTIARVMFQQDLWNRYDGLFDDGAGDRRTRTRRERLKTLLGRLIVRTAPSIAELRALPSTLEDVGRRQGEVAGALIAPDSPWRELVFTAEGETTSHARTAGHRRVTRIFVRYPEWAGGAQCLEARLGDGEPVLPGCPEGHVLPTGGAALLVETPLAVSDSAELVPVPVVLAVQSRRVRVIEPGPDGRFGLEDLPVEVLHASRRALVSGSSKDVLVPLPPEELVPQGLGCFPRPEGGQMLPVSLSCSVCHGLEGRGLMSLARLEPQPVRVLATENTVATDAVLRTKAARPSFRALQRFFVPDPPAHRRPARKRNSRAAALVHD